MMRRFRAVLIGRNKEFLRDRGAVGWNILFPFFVVFGMAFAFSEKAQDVFKVGVVGEISSLPSGFASTKHLKFVAFPDETAALAKLRHHQLDMLVEAGRPLIYWVNEKSPKGYLVERVMLGTDAAGFTPERKAVEGRPIRYVDWLVAGLLSMNMMFSALFGVGYTLVRYRKNGVLKRLKATPLRAVEFLAAQVISRLILIMAVFVIVYHGSNYFLHFQRLGSLFDLYLIFTLGSACMVSLGLLVAARVASEELAGGVLNMLSWPMMFLSGVWFSLEGAPRAMRLVADMMPLTHMIAAARAVMTEGATLSQVAPHLYILAGMTALFLAVGAWTFRWD
ncbi:MAG: ABC transporter permease [Elusimicrobia bacterium CG11_big_fil_rev_8_21_14_0_20_64_6]|nr:MAG: ABC transporter permease [Elusimicrobia bacterium CG11_big_fil_rev_8_21_14_0_20_64_6]